MPVRQEAQKQDDYNQTGKGHAILEEETQKKEKEKKNCIKLLFSRPNNTGLLLTRAPRQAAFNSQFMPWPHLSTLSEHLIFLFIYKKDSWWLCGLDRALHALCSKVPLCTADSALDWCFHVKTLQKPDWLGLRLKKRTTNTTENKDLWCEDVYPFAKKNQTNKRSTEHNCNPMARKDWKHGG